MTATDTGKKITRKRGRPLAKARPPCESVYDFPSLDDIQRMSDTQVQAAFTELGIEPKPFAWNEEDNQINVARWHDYRMSMSDADRIKSAPALTDKAALKALKDASFTIYQRNLRLELLGAYLEQWVATLSDVQLIHECERLSEDKLSESEKRYLKRSDLQERVSQLVWPELVRQSKLYSPTKQSGG